MIKSSKKTVKWIFEPFPGSDTEYNWKENLEDFIYPRFICFFPKKLFFQSKQIPTFGDFVKRSGGEKVRARSNQMSTAGCPTLYPKIYLPDYDQYLISY